MEFLKRQFLILLAKLKETNRPWVEQNFSCPVCTELPEELNILDCGHIICPECYDTLIKMEKYSCPVCRQFIKISNNSDVSNEQPDTSGMVDFRQAFFEQIGIMLKQRVNPLTKYENNIQR